MNNSLLLFNITIPLLINSITATSGTDFQHCDFVIFSGAVYAKAPESLFLHCLGFFLFCFVFIERLKNKTNFADLNSEGSDNAAEEKYYPNHSGHT